MFRAVIILVFSLSLSASAWSGNWNTGSSSSSQEILQTQNPIAALSGFGVNSMALWSGASRTDPYRERGFLEHFKPLEVFGVKHVVLVSCADWIINIECKKPFQNLEGIIKSAKLLLENTGLHVVVQLKAYKRGKVNGINISKLNTRLEESDAVASIFTDSWESIATQLKGYPPNRLSFNLLNEPEFEIPKPTRLKRDRWLSIAKRTASTIRAVSPNRTIIVEGISKSLFADRNSGGVYKYNSPDELLIPIGMRNVIYAFHNYEPENFLQQAKYRYGSYGREYSKNHSQMVSNDAQRAIKWANRHKVPMMLTETGCIGYLEGKEGPKTNDECGKFAADIQKRYIDNGVGVTWWALEKEKTIYNRTCPDGCWMPENLVPNNSLFSGFQLDQTARLEKYDRTSGGLVKRFSCLLEYGKIHNMEDMPSRKNIETFIKNIEQMGFTADASVTIGTDAKKLSSFQLVRLGLPKVSVAKHKKVFMKLVNYEGTNEEYCGEPPL